MKKCLLSILSILTLSYSACKQDTAELEALRLKIENKKNGGGGSNDSYLPTTKGSSWTYQSDMTGSTELSTSYLTGAITPINGQNYYELKTTALGKESIGYYFVKDKKYKVRSATVESNTMLEFFILDDNLPVGGEWVATMTADGSVNGVPGRTKNKIIESGITKTVLNKTYKNVIHTHIIVQYDLGSGFQNFVDYNFYLAKGVGVIETDTNFGTYKTSSYLFDYSIK